MHRSYRAWKHCRSSAMKRQELRHFDYYCCFDSSFTGKSPHAGSCFSDSYARVNGAWQVLLQPICYHSDYPVFAWLLPLCHSFTGLSWAFLWGIPRRFDLFSVVLYCLNVAFPGCARAASFLWLFLDGLFWRPHWAKSWGNWLSPLVDVCWSFRHVKGTCNLHRQSL